VDNPLVRKAISASIDRALLTEVITRGNEEPARTYTTPPAFGYVPSVEKIGIGFDPLQAKKWLTEAGYPEGKGFPEITLLYEASDVHEKIARAVREFLKHYLNIDIKLQGKDWVSYMDAVTGKPPHIFQAGWCGDYPDADNWLEIFHPSRGFYNIGWGNREFAEIIDKAVKESDREKRMAYYKSAEWLLCEREAAVVPLFFEIAHYLVKPRLKGWYHMALGGQHIRDWQFKEN
jgi:oligopeptide transport system substrate-binding protein